MALFGLGKRMHLQRDASVHERPLIAADLTVGPDAGGTGDDESRHGVLVDQFLHHPQHIGRLLPLVDQDRLRGDPQGGFHVQHEGLALLRLREVDGGLCQLEGGGRLANPARTRDDYSRPDFEFSAKPRIDLPGYVAGLGRDVRMAQHHAVPSEVRRARRLIVDGITPQALAE